MYVTYSDGTNNIFQINSNSITLVGANYTDTPSVSGNILNINLLDPNYSKDYLK